MGGWLIVPYGKLDSDVYYSILLYYNRFRINLSIIFISMGFVAHSPPNFDAALKSLGVPEGPVQTQAFGNLPLFSQVISSF